MKTKVIENELHIFPENEEEIKICTFLLQAEQPNTEIIVLHNTID